MSIDSLRSPCGLPTAVVLRYASILSKAYFSSRLGGSAGGYIWVMQDDDLPMRFTFDTNVLPYFVT